MLVLSRPHLGLPELGAHLTRGLLETQGEGDCDRKREHVPKSLARASLPPEVYWRNRAGVLPWLQGGRRRKREGVKTMAEEEGQETDHTGHGNRDERDRDEGHGRDAWASKPREDVTVGAGEPEVGPSGSAFRGAAWSLYLVLLRGHSPGRTDLALEREARVCGPQSS